MSAQTPRAGPQRPDRESLSRPRVGYAAGGAALSAGETVGRRASQDKTDEALEAGLINAIGKEAYVRAWGWTPDTARDGTPIPEAERRTLQQFKIKQKSEGRGRKPSATVPAF